MTDIKGVRTVYNIGGKETGGRIAVDMRDQIAQLEPDDAPFITFLRASKKNTRVAHNPKFEWMEDQLTGVSDAIGTGGASASGTVPVVNGAVFRPGDVILCGTEVMLVSSISSNTLTVARGWGANGTGAAHSAGDVVYIIGNAFAENAKSGDALTTQVTECFNYTQIFRTPVQLSNTADKTKMYGGADRGYQRGKALLEHKRAIARAFYAGKRDIDGTTHTLRTTGGLFSFMTQTQAFAASGGTPLNYANFDQYVAQKVFRYGSKEKLMFVGNKLSTVINQWALNKVVTNVDTSATFGMRVAKLATSYGDLMVAYDPLLDDLGHSDYGVIVDTKNVNYVNLDGRDTKLYTNIQDNDQDGIKDEYLTECGLEVRLPKTHMLITGAYIPAS